MERDILDWIPRNSASSRPPRIFQRISLAKEQRRPSLLAGSTYHPRRGTGSASKCLNNGTRVGKYFYGYLGTTARAHSAAEASTFDEARESCSRGTPLLSRQLLRTLGPYFFLVPVAADKASQLPATDNAAFYNGAPSSRAKNMKRWGRRFTKQVKGRI